MQRVFSVKCHSLNQITAERANSFLPLAFPNYLCFLLFARLCLGIVCSQLATFLLLRFKHCVAKFARDTNLANVVLEALTPKHCLEHLLRVDHVLLLLHLRAITLQTTERYETVVLLALVKVAQYAVRLAHQLELVVVALILIGMVLQCQAVVRLLDLCLRRLVILQAQNFIVVALFWLRGGDLRLCFVLTDD